MIVFSLRVFNVIAWSAPLLKSEQLLKILLKLQSICISSWVGLFAVDNEFFFTEKLSGILRYLIVYFASDSMVDYICTFGSINIAWLVEAVEISCSCQFLMDRSKVTSRERIRAEMNYDQTMLGKIQTSNRGSECHSCHCCCYRCCY